MYKANLKDPATLYALYVFSIVGVKVIKTGVRATKTASRSIKTAIDKKREINIKYEKLVPEYLVNFNVIEA